MSLVHEVKAAIKMQQKDLRHSATTVAFHGALIVDLGWTRRIVAWVCTRSRSSDFTPKGVTFFICTCSRRSDFTLGVTFFHFHHNFVIPPHTRLHIPTSTPPPPPLTPIINKHSSGLDVWFDSDRAMGEPQAGLQLEDSLQLSTGVLQCAHLSLSHGHYLVVLDGARTLRCVSCFNLNIIFVPHGGL